MLAVCAIRLESQPSQKPLAGADGPKSSAAQASRRLKLEPSYSCMRGAWLKTCCIPEAKTKSYQITLCGSLTHDLLHSIAEANLPVGGVGAVDRR